LPEAVFILPKRVSGQSKAGVRGIGIDDE
jgi:hypothetical protein